MNRLKKNSLRRVGWLILLTFIISLQLVHSASAGNKYVSAIEYEKVVKKTVMVSMRDGTKLSTDLHFPSLDGLNPAGGRFPSILQRTPYYRASKNNTKDAQYFAHRGYIAVLQDIRGRFGSKGQGNFDAYDGEGFQGPDGYDTVEWIANQDWSDGKVGTWGLSFPGCMAYSLLCFAPPHLNSFLACASGTNYWRHGIRHYGAFEMRFLHGAWMIGPMDMEPEIKNLFLGPLGAKDFDNVLDAWPLRRGESLLAKVPQFEDWYFKIVSESDYPGPLNYWGMPGHRSELYYNDMPDIPMLHYVSWYDSYIGIQDKFHIDLSKIKKRPQYLVISARTHTDDFNSTVSGDIELGPESAEDYSEFIVKWHDQWLKSKDTGIIKEPPVRLYIMGTGTGRKTKEGHLDVGGFWRNENEWPLARTQFTKYYFQRDGELSQKAPTIRDSSSTYPYDPDHPVPSIGGNISAFGGWLVPSGFNQVITEKVPHYVKGERTLGALSDRPDVLVFETGVLEGDVEITGPIEVKLWVSTDCVDTDFTAKLIDSFPSNEDYPDGYALNLADGIARGRYRGGLTVQKLMEPGKIYEMEIHLAATGMIFRKGHKIRVDISSSNYPRFDFNPNTGEPLGLHENIKIANNTLYHDSKHPSHIILPVIPSK